MKRIILLTVLGPTLALTGGLAGCATSPPSSFYLLTPVAATQSPAPSGRLRARVKVAAVHLPPTLDRQQIVRTGPGNRLEISGFHRWGAPLDEMVQRVLTQDLLERLPKGAVILPESPAPTHTDRIVVDLLALQSDTGGQVTLRGSWSLLGPLSNTPLIVRDVHYEAATRAVDFNAQAGVLSEMLGRLAGDIAHHLPRH